MPERPPFTEGQIVHDEDGRRFRVTQAEIPGPEIPRAFEIISIDPPKPFPQAFGMAQFYEVEDEEARS